MIIKAQGNGEIEYMNGNVYKGQWKNNQKHGIGMLQFSSDDSASSNRYDYYYG